MEGDDPVPGHMAEGGEGQASPRGPGSQDGPGDHEGPGRGGSGEPGAVPREAPQAAQALESPVGGAAAEPAAMARIPRPAPLQFSLLVPFRSSVEADIAGHLMTPGAQTHLAAGHQEVTVSGSLLAIRLSAEDTDQLRLSITSCLQELLLVIRTMRHMLPPFVVVSPNRVNRG